MFLEKSNLGNSRWTLYLATILIVFIATQLGSIPFAIYAAFKTPNAIMTGDISAITNTNMGLAMIMFVYVVAFFALILSIRLLHKKRLNDIITGRNHFDLKRVAFGMLVWGAILLITFAVQYLAIDSSSLVFNFKQEKFFVMLLIILLMMPFQVAWEEFLFRGYLMQGIASIFKNRWAPLILTGVIFGMMHIANPEVKEFGLLLAMPQYIIMGLLLGYVAIKDDGIELALGIHLINNMLSVTLITHSASALQTHSLFIDTNPKASIWDSIVMLVCGVIFIWICNRKFHFLNKNRIISKINFIKSR